MKDKTLKCGFSMPMLGMGTWLMGGRDTRDPNDDGEACVAALRQGIQMGFRHIDTAEYYADGFSEEIVGRAIEGLSREELFLVSKVWKTHLHYDDVLRAAERTLKRLGTDYLDLYLVHQVDESVPLQETMRAMSRLAEEGIARWIGVSNFATPRLAAAQAYASVKVVVNQVHYNLQVREPESSGLLDYCRKNDVMLTAWRPLQKGTLMAEPPNSVKCVAERYELTPSQVALSWLTSQENVTAIVMSRNEGHLKDNMAAADVVLSQDDVELLRRDYPDQLTVSNNVPLK